MALAISVTQLRRADRTGRWARHRRRDYRRICTTVVAAVPEGAAALVVGHGGGIEPGLVPCLPDADPELWGAPFGHCDGARLGFDGDRFISVQFRRRPSEQLPGGAKAGGR